MTTARMIAVEKKTQKESVGSGNASVSQVLPGPIVWKM